MVESMFSWIVTLTNSGQGNGGPCNRKIEQYKDFGGPTDPIKILVPAGGLLSTLARDLPTSK